MPIDLTMHKIEVGDRPAVYRDSQPIFIQAIEDEVNSIETKANSALFEPPNDGLFYGRKRTPGETTGHWIPLEIV